MAGNGETPTQRQTRFRRSLQAARERSSHIRERLRPQNLRAPSLDWLNFLLADVRGGLGPFVGVFLVARAGWDQATLGAVLTASGLLGITAQAPIGALIDATRRKRALLVAGVAALAA